MTRAAQLAAERLAQIGAIGRVLMQQMMENLHDMPETGDGCEETINAVVDLLVDEKLCTRAEFQRFVAVERARTDQQLAEKRGSPDD